MILKSIKHFLAASRTCIHWHYLSKRKNSVEGVHIFIIRKTKILSISWSCPRFNHSSQSPAQVEVTPVHYSTWCRYARAFPQLYVDFGSPAGPGANQVLAGPRGHTSSVWMSSFYPLTPAFTKRPMCLPTVGSLPLAEALYMLSAAHNQHGLAHRRHSVCIWWRREQSVGRIATLLIPSVYTWRGQELLEGVDQFANS